MGQETCIALLVGLPLGVLGLIVFLKRLIERAPRGGYDPEEHPPKPGWEGWDDPNRQGYQEMEREAKYPDR